MSKSTFLQDIIEMPAAVRAIGNNLISRIIDQTSRGFGEDVENIGRIGVYKALCLVNDQIVDPGTMFSSMANRPTNNKLSFLENSNLSDDVKNKLFGTLEQQQQQPLLDSAEQLVQLLEATEPNLDGWHDISPVGQYTVAVRSSNKLYDYKDQLVEWISSAEQRAEHQQEQGQPPTATSAPSHKRNVTRLKETEDALKKMPKAVDKLEKLYKAELDEAIANDVRIPERRVG